MKKQVLFFFAAALLLAAVVPAEAQDKFVNVRMQSREYQLVPRPLQYPVSRFIEAWNRELGGKYFVLMSPNRYEKNLVWYLLFSANVGNGRDTVSAQFSFPVKLVVVYLDNSKKEPTVSFGFGRAFIRISEKEYYKTGAQVVLPDPNNKRVVKR
jgi:hypothetical protein